MKLATAAAVLTLAAAGAASAQTAPVTLNLNSSKSGGQAIVAVFADAASLKATKNPVVQAKAPMDGAQGTVRLPDLKPGDYAIAVIHDVDGDGKLDTLPVGLPTEPYGFSNGARGRFGPPSWASAKVTVAGPTTLAIRLK